MFEKLVRLLVGWHTKLKNWHAVWHGVTFIGTLALWHVKMGCWYAGTLARKPRWHGSTLARCWHVVDLVNSIFYTSS